MSIGSSSDRPDALPSLTFGAPPQAVEDIHLEGDEVVKALRLVADRLAQVDTTKDAVLLMISVFYSAVGHTLLIQREGEPPQAIRNLWR